MIVLIKEVLLLNGKKKYFRLLKNVINSEVLQWKYERFLINKNNNFNKEKILKILSAEDIDDSF